MSGPKLWRNVAVLISVVFASVAIAKALGQEIRIPVGNLVVGFNFNSAPKKLPAHRNAPISFWGSASIGTNDGSVPSQLEHLEVEFDRFGDLETRGLPVCRRGQLIATTTPQARRACPGAIVATGHGTATIAFPDQPPIDAGSPLTFFNGPKVGGDDSVIVHAHLNVPVPTTYVVAVRIERIHRGIYGFRVRSDVPEIAGGSGSITGFDFRFDDLSWHFEGEEMHYLTAHCPIGRLQALIRASFEDGTRMQADFIDPCQARN